MISFFTPRRLSVQRIINLIPRDGCLLVFNGNYANWSTHTSKTKIFHTAVADPGGPQKCEEIRDLYLCWRADHLDHPRYAAAEAIAHKLRPRGDNVVDLIDTLKKGISAESASKEKARRKAPSGQKEMLMSASGGKKPAKRAAKKSAKSDRRSA